MGEGGLPASAAHAREAVLRGVPEWDQVGGEWAGQWFSSARELTRCLAFLGDPVPGHELMGVSGAAWRALWDEGRWRPHGCGSMAYYGHLVEERRMFDAIGRGFQYLGIPGTRAQTGHSVDEIRAVICHEIVSGRPVIGCGVVRPCITEPHRQTIIGYRDSGRVLVLSDQGPSIAEPRDLADWEHEPELRGFLAIGEKRPAPSGRDTLIGALRVALDMARAPQASGRASGVAAYDAWARDLLCDDRFTPGDAGTLRRFADFCGTVALGHVDARPAAARYLRSALQYTNPAARQRLQAAAASCDSEFDALMSGGHEIPWGAEQGWDLARVTSRANREALAAAILRAKEHYQRAIDEVEAALRADHAL